VVGDLRVVAARVAAPDRDSLLQLADHVRDRLGRGVAVLAAEWDGKASIVVTITPDLVAEKRLHAGHLVKAIAGRVGGRGGGKPGTAQAGLPGPRQITAALTAAVDVVRESLAGG
jgi:alanyl-tRNA synthetase